MNLGENFNSSKRAISLTIGPNQILPSYTDGADILVISVRDQPVWVRRSMIGIDLCIECKMFYISESFDKMFAAGLMSNRVSKRQQGNKR